MTADDDTRAVWAHGGLSVADGRLLIAGRDAEALGREHGTPLYVFDLCRITEQVAALQQALAGAGLRYVTRFSMKAQREPEVLAHLRRLGPPLTPQPIGADVCSPVELASALASGWQGDEISYTGTNVSDRDFEAILAQPIRLNVDCLSQLRRLARHQRDRDVGLRVNVRCGAGHSGRCGRQPLQQRQADEVRRLRGAASRGHRDRARRRAHHHRPALPRQQRSCRRRSGRLRRDGAAGCGDGLATCWRPAVRSMRSTPVAAST